MNISTPVVAASVLIATIMTGCSIGNSLATQSELRSPENTSYSIDGTIVHLTNGTETTQAAPGSSSTVKTAIFEVSQSSDDLNQDGRADRVVILMQNTGGSGTFYYAAAAIQTGNGYIGTNAIFLGDRIAPQSVTMTNGMMQVNYADRTPDESFSVPPSQGKTLFAVYTNDRLTAVMPE